MIITTMVLLAAAAPAPPVFAVFARASWADRLEGCEPEFTEGFKIRRGEISHYHGSSKLVSIGELAKVETPSGTGLSFTARIRHQEADNPPQVVLERFTVVGDVLYHGPAAESLAKHLAAGNRMVRCPPGSTGG